MDWLESNHLDAYGYILKEFPEWPYRVFEGSWLNTEAMGVDPEYSSWLIDAIEDTGYVLWEEGEPWAMNGDDLKTMDEYWNDVVDELSSALAIAWDGCHKIYLLMDTEQLAITEGYGYDLLDVGRPEDSLLVLKDWWDLSCGLRFISSVRTHDDPNAGFRDLIPQFAEFDE